MFTFTVYVAFFILAGNIIWYRKRILNFHFVYIPSCLQGIAQNVPGLFSRHRSQHCLLATTGNTCRAHSFYTLREGNREATGEKCGFHWICSNMAAPGRLLWTLLRLNISSVDVMKRNDKLTLVRYLRRVNLYSLNLIVGDEILSLRSECVRSPDTCW